MRRRFDGRLARELLRPRRSAKWRRYPPDVLPAWVAELDFALAPPVARGARRRVERSDTGYANRGRLPACVRARSPPLAGAGRSTRSTSRLVADVMSGVAELLRALTEPGDAVVVNPPVYPPFFTIVARGRARGRRGAARRRDWRLDLDALEQRIRRRRPRLPALQPAQPHRHACTRGTSSQAVAELADALRRDRRRRRGARADDAAGRDARPRISERRGPRAASRSSAPARRGTSPGSSARSSWPARSAMRRAARRALPKHVRYHVGHFGVIALVAAFEDGGAWLDALVAHLDRNRAPPRRAARGGAAGGRLVPPQAGYLAWLDCRELGLGDDPSEAFLERGRVALSPGPPFGSRGQGLRAAELRHLGRAARREPVARGCAQRSDGSASRESTAPGAAGSTAATTSADVQAVPEGRLGRREHARDEARVRPRRAGCSRRGLRRVRRHARRA